MSRLDELDVVLRRRGEKMVAGIPALRLYATADDTVAALAALETKKRAYELDLQDAGLTETFDASSTAETPARSIAKHGELRMFALKAGIVVGFVTVAALLAGGLIAAKVDETIFRASYALRTSLLSFPGAEIGGPLFWQKADQNLGRAGAFIDRMTPEEQQRMLTSVRIAVARLRPFAAELAPLLNAARGEAEQSPAQTRK